MNKTVKKALEMNQFNNNLPKLEVGDIVELEEVWDGEGEAPTYSYSYLLTNDGEDGDSNVDVSINYEFEIIEANEDELKTTVKITNICLI